MGSDCDVRRVLSQNFVPLFIVSVGAEAMVIPSALIFEFTVGSSVHGPQLLWLSKLQPSGAACGDRRQG